MDMQLNEHADNPEPDAAAPGRTTGGRPAYEQLFARNLPALTAYLRARVGSALAQRESISDLTQSVCREVLDDLGELKFDSEEAFRAYLFLQASRKVVDRSRYHKMAKRDPAREVTMPTDVESRELLRSLAMLVTPSRAAGAREELDRVETALQELPENQREAVLLSRIAGISYGDIAAQMELSESAVRGLVARGLARLAAMLGRP
ncbi:MAG: sigma-70 family RNA polymerase sigma factor [Planctomycetes bacterium]|nr:sigma-70 family RNA polymerase sigma factor [Planctomycetota bacterium]